MRKKPRLQRIERDSGVDMHIEEEGNLWAVSYADFLMVLISFFVIFFTTNPDDKDSIISIIAQETGAGAGQGDQAGTGSGTATGSGFATNAQQGGSAKTKPEDKDAPSSIEEYFKKFSSLEFKVKRDRKSLILFFPDNSFNAGSFELTKPLEEKLSRVIEIIDPFLEKIEMVFIGHSDSTPISRTKNRYIRNNFDLSSMRATRALSYAVSKGIPEAQVSAQGSADTKRGSRSLTLKIKAKGEKL